MDLGQNHFSNKVKFIIIITEKYYYIRFFPPIGSIVNKNDNPIPSIIINYNIIYPFENNIYLYSYIIIQGTTRTYLLLYINK